MHLWPNIVFWQVQNTSTSTTGTSTTVAWCVRDDPAQRSQRDTWCPSGVDSETALPLYADVELSDSNGVLLVGVSSVQLSLNESSPLALRFPGSSGRLVLLSPQWQACKEIHRIFLVWPRGYVHSCFILFLFLFLLLSTYIYHAILSP